MGLVGTRTEHRYQLCRDDGCDRYPCVVYKEGLRNGFTEGWQAGYPAGYVKGYEEGYRSGYEAGHKQGFRDGIDACPRPHQ